MTFAKPRSRVDPEPRRQAVKIEVATGTRDAIVAHIEAGLDEQNERGKQELIGPSGLGEPCDFCLGAKLAGLEEMPDLGWSAYGGTQVHEGLGRMFAPYSTQWATDRLVTVGEVDGQEIKGTLDLFDFDRNTVVDFKYPMSRTLDKVRYSGRVPQNYELQAALYARGMRREGWKVTHIAVFFLPRCTHITKPRELWSRGFWWAREFDEDDAVRALERADRIARHIRLVGPEIVLPSLERMEGCYGCKRWINPYQQPEKE